MNLHKALIGLLLGLGLLLSLLLNLWAATEAVAQEAPAAWKDVPAKGLLKTLQKASSKAAKSCPNGKTVGQALKHFQKHQIGPTAARCHPDGNKKNAKVCVLEFNVPETEDGGGEVLWGLQYNIKGDDPKSVRQVTCLRIAG